MDYWQGRTSHLESEDAPFVRIHFGGEAYIYKPTYDAPICGGTHRSLGLSKINTALRLGAYPGVEPFIFTYIGPCDIEDRAMFLEKEVAAIPGRRNSDKQHDHFFLDICPPSGGSCDLAGKGVCATSLADLCLPFDKKTLRRVHLRAFQSFALLCMIGRCDMLNTDDVLLTEADEPGFLLLLGDAKKAFNFECGSGVQVFDTQFHQKRAAGPLDELQDVYDR